MSRCWYTQTQGKAPRLKVYAVSGGKAGKDQRKRPATQSGEEETIKGNLHRGMSGSAKRNGCLHHLAGPKELPGRGGPGVGTSARMRPGRKRLYMLDQSQQRPVPGTSTQQEAREGLMDVGMRIIYYQTVSKGVCRRQPSSAQAQLAGQTEVVSWNGLHRSVCCFSGCPFRCI